MPRENIFRADFPLLQRKMSDKPLIYLDSAATTQKPQCVLDALAEYYAKFNANPHRGAYELGVEATNLYEEARDKVQKFIGAKHREEIIFTRNATESLNLVAYSYGLANINKGDEIVLTIAEHHSNLVPWQQIAKAKGAILKYVYLNHDGTINLEEFQDKITQKTKVVAITEISNVLGMINPVQDIAKLAHQKGAVVVVDGSQSVPHMKVDVQKLDADFFAFSGHKMLAPMGIGVLYGKKDLLEAMPPFLTGGDMIDYVHEEETAFAELPMKFEAGTQNVGGAVGLSSAIDYLLKVGFPFIEGTEKRLLEYAIPRLKELPFLELYGCDNLTHKTGIITFNVSDVHPHDVSTILDAEGVAIRAGHHCAEPLMHYLGQNATCRASLYFYNTEEDLDKLIEGLKNVRKVMHLGTC